jgi:hypothetical protein
MTGVPARHMHRSERLVGLLATRRPQPTVTVARSVSGVLDDHVVFEVESIDRISLNVGQPGWPTAVGWRASSSATVAITTPPRR